MATYDTESISFCLNRMAFYASLRGASAYLVSPLGMPLWVDRTLPFWVGLAETVIMAVPPTSTAYVFRFPDLRFLEYSILKSAVLLTLPRLEEILLPLGCESDFFLVCYISNPETCNK
jgi:hypothetical protein